MISEGNAIRSLRTGVKAEQGARASASSVRRAVNTFFKLLYRYTHSRAWRHNERLAHGVALERDEAGRLVGMCIRGRRIACANTQMASAPALRHAGQACHLIATGPSVNTIDYRALHMTHVLGVNGAIALTERQGVSFDYYCIVDTGFVRNRPDLVERVIGEPLTLFATPHVLWHIAERIGVERIRCRVFLLDDMLFPAGRRAPRARELRTTYDTQALALFDTPKPLGFSLDLRCGVFDGRTVAYTGLQVLAALGFTRLYLHGVDLTDAKRTPRFYEESASTMQPSHLDENFPGFIEPSFRHASALLTRRGVDVRNLSMESALGEDIFPKLRWQMLAQAGMGDAMPATMPTFTPAPAPESARAPASRTR
ncbi:TPA: hypothetical protein QDC20_001524 [Burkholderia aenigmatica]|uniref:hypothetical protein n=1 Tax=Burkholderia sp. AU45251 TaxID=3059204 RepID=UPI0026508B03|nr:hypothetical protein [Burkholderia sp. AU45251]HDR9485868.1 hypothetical protein [Burkholderia aenigmatica]MDN7519250.1 hypothetical protein [Burkholderia sp. AU45251]HDR9517235.1 hypothetical protein [Burkholderia aenigmatica]HDR9594291.1 hypothetical protein [Burkholderia aenigmatica]HDR9601518.1 hypothetical protein [Burkholderia aenigmatica]